MGSTKCDPGPTLVQVEPMAVGTRRMQWQYDRATVLPSRSISPSPGAPSPTTASTWPHARSCRAFRGATGTPSPPPRPLLPRLPGGDGHSILVLPGLLADDVSTRALRTVLRKLGYDVHGWGLGRNIGPTAACVKGTRDLLDHLSDSSGKPVTVIGWS